VCSMDEASDLSSRDAAARLPHDRLDSWKQIAGYLGRGVTTAQRWEQEGLPVHRLPHAKKGSVFAFKHEIDAWLMAREQSGVVPTSDAVSPIAGREDRPSARSTGRYSRAAFLALAVAVLLTAAYLFASFSRRAASLSTAATTHVRTVAPRPLANDEASEAYPTLSPDGERLVYFWGRPNGGGLYIKAIAAGAARPLLTENASRFARAAFAKWSPRGDLIAFLAPEEGANRDTRGLYVVSASGGTPRQLTTVAGTGLCWMPDGDTLAFSDRSSTGEPFSIFALSLASGDRRRLTTPPAGTFGDTRCAVSPDGRRLAVSRYPSRYESDVYVMPVPPGAGEVEQLTHEGSGIMGIDWTPDGSAVAFSTHNGLWTVPVSQQTSQAPRLIVAAAAVRELTFSRPARGTPARLVYHYSANDVNIWRWDAPANLRKIASSTTWEDHPAISPDNRRIAFASNRTAANEIWVAAADGSDARQLTFYNGPIVISPRWSPDGRRIVFSSQVAGNRDIYVIHADGSRPTRLTWEASQDDNPSWSRDGRWIYFRSDRDGIARIWKMPPDGGAAVRITSGPGSQGIESPDGKALYFVRSMDVPGLWSVPTAGGKETFVLPDVRETFWDVADTGIAFLTVDPAVSADGPAIRFFDFSSRTVSTLLTLSIRADRISPGFAVARDGRSIVWTQGDGLQGDLMLIDPWPP
jgi:Tol biopolymer transport system component